MRKRVVLVSVLSLVMVLGASCRSRRQPAPPRTTPPVEVTTTAPETSTPVTPADREFEQPAPTRDVLSEDIAEADRMARERGWIRDAFFAFDASTLDAAGQDALRQSATWLREHPEFRIRIEGHCDELGTEQYNLALGDRRAEAAASFLAASGVDRSRIQTVSYGEERPFEEGSGDEARAQNRRAHLVLAGRR